MTVNEVRSKYLAFFKARGHAVIPSAPIVPENDPTTLFTSSGMQPLVPYLLGQPHPEGARLSDSQTSFRAEDIEEVGDNRHTTFFEMLGNWSLGDYFKAEQLPWFFEFLTNELGLDASRLYITTFAGDEASGMAADDESIGIWQKLFGGAGLSNGFATMGTEEEAAARGMREGERIFAYGAKKNWWSRSGTPAKMPAGEIGGPDSEVFYDFGLPHDPSFGAHCHPNCDCGRFIEIGNSVFIQYVKQQDGSFKELPKRNVDFGGGLERLAAATLGDPDIFLVDVFDAARSVLEQRSGLKYGDIVSPQHSEGLTMSKIRSFRIILDHMRAASFMLATGIVPGNSEQPYVLRRLIRRSIREADKLGIKDAVLAEVAEGYGDAYAEAYPFVKANAAFIREQLEKEEEQFRKTLDSGLKQFGKWYKTTESFYEGERSDAEVHRELEAKPKRLPGFVAFDLFTTHGFPIELTIEEAKSLGMEVDIEDFNKEMRKHREESRAGAAQKFAGGLADHQEQTIKYHTAHHLLLKALQQVLGPEVHQRGSNITSERLRMDFSFPRKMTPEEVAEAEKIVNDQIEAALPVTRTVMAKEEAEKLGAEHEFGASYPEQVSVYSVGPANATAEDPQFSEAFSIEFCGGPHVANTAELGEGGKRFKIAKEEASSAGVRRIRAVLQ